MPVGVLLLSLLGSAHAATARTLIATAERVMDSDTIVPLTSDGTNLRIDLLGIDAPGLAYGAKLAQPSGKEARDYLDHLIGSKMVHVEEP